MPKLTELFRLAFFVAGFVLVAIGGLGACSGDSSAGNPMDDGVMAGSWSGGASSGGSSTGGSSTGGSATGGNSGSGGATEGCPGGCVDGTCFQELDGTWGCVGRPTDVPRETCETFDAMCCSQDSECTEDSNGRCISDTATYFGCGGAVPFGNSCHYDTCVTDADCPALEGAAFAVCVPPGALGTINSLCVHGGCRTNADCTTHPGGQCLYGEARTHGTCDRRKVFYCAYPSDPCQNSNTGCSGPLLCLPEESYDGRGCAAPPPMYP